jgi:hypothetical protein
LLLCFNFMILKFLLVESKGSYFKQ